MPIEGMLPQPTAVDAGPVAPAFELPGDSIQYRLAYSKSNDKLLADTRVRDLTAGNEYLTEKSVEEGAPK
ncbi:hypothetical protein [Streptomyces diastatochromogenes]|uniref:hypothetical protein n=1 Tax=Streptomyces diastatochromogenes TaxID=42236 RepID=UPI003689317D